MLDCLEAVVSTICALKRYMKTIFYKYPIEKGMGDVQKKVTILMVFTSFYKNLERLKTF